MKEPAIHIRDLSVTIDDNLILQNIDLDVADGEVVSVIGPSGCGKTTLLNVVAGLLPSWVGTVSARGVPVAGPGSDRAVVFQEDAVFPWMTVRQNIGYAPRLRKASKSTIDIVVEEMTGLVGLAGKEDLYPKQLSGGQRKRVDLARALAAHPSVLLMDEPYAALDQMTKQHLQHEFLNAVIREKMTSVFVTHDLEEAIYVADRIVVMAASPGRIVEIVEVPFGHERVSDLRMTEDFQAIRRRIAQSVRMPEEMAA